MAPRVSLKVIQTWIGYHLARAVDLPEHVFGFVPGRSTVQAARVHCGAVWVLSIDLKDFFQTTPWAMVSSALQRLGYQGHGLNTIKGLCGLEGGLPQGSPASPVLSNLAFQPVDDRLRQIADDFGVRFTRYADDLAFSGTDQSSADELLSSVTQIIIQSGWRISENKTHLAVKPNRLKVLGLLVSGDRPRLTKGYRNRLRAYRHLLTQGKISDSDLDRVRGHLAYAASVKPEQ